MLKRIGYLALALSAPLFEASPRCRADSVTVNAFAQAHTYPPGADEIHKQDDQGETGGSGASASASAIAGPVEARAQASAHITRSGYSGQYVYRASSSTSAPGPPEYPFLAEAGTIGNFLVYVTAPTEIVPLYVVYGVSGTGGSGTLDVTGAGGTSFNVGQTGFLTGYASGESAGILGTISNHGTTGQTNNTVMSVIWGAGELPGLRKDNPLASESLNQGGGQLPPRPPLTEGESLPTTPPVEVTGSFFHAPVTQGYGIGNLIYLDPAIASGYLYQVEGTRFATFTIPDPLPGGDSLFQLAFGGNFYDYHAGDIFDFTLYNPDGLSSFYLLGIDESEMIDPGAAHAPFVSGLSFTTEGVAQIWQTALVSSAVPEPSSVVMLGLGAIGVIGATIRRRSSE